MSYKSIAKKILSTTGLYREFKASKKITDNFVPSTPEMLQKVHQSMESNLPGFGQENLEFRLNRFREWHIPFLEHCKPLKGAKVLEIGCGTGCSTVALAEQGANVIGIDIDDKSLNVCRDRLSIYNLQAETIKMNADDICDKFPDNTFDVVIFFATMEHLTNPEKREAIRQSWRVTKPGGIWCILGTPNLLWHFDSHTSLLPHFFWLPDDIAFEYAQFSPRQEFVDFSKGSDYLSHKQEFERWGRGVSYHHIDLYIGDVTKLNVLGSMHQYIRSQQSIFQRLIGKYGLHNRFREILKETGRKGVPLPFYENYLDFAIQKG